MNLQDMIKTIVGTHGNRYQLGTEDVLRYMDIAQKVAFNRDCMAFIKTSMFGEPEEITEGSFKQFRYDMPHDCRTIIEIKTKGKYFIDEFNRKIKSEHSCEEVSYYRRPETLTISENSITNEAEFTIEDEAKVIVPEEWRHQVLVEATKALCDTDNYGDRTTQQILETFFYEFWQAMNVRRNDRGILSSFGMW